MANKKRTFISEIDWLMKDWFWEKNDAEGIFPDRISTGSTKYAWWKCYDCGHEEYKRCDHRAAGHGCTKCSFKNRGKKRSKIYVEKNGSLADHYPELVKEFHPTKNRNKTPYNLSPGTKTVVWWICPNGHEYDAAVSFRTRGGGCKYCANKAVLYGWNDLETKYPELAAEWHPTKNGDLTPRQVLPNRNEKVYWICPLGHSYDQEPYNRLQGNGCPYCSGKKVLIGYNDLKSQRPDLAEEWNYEKNFPLTPEQVTTGSKEKVEWICKTCGFEWPSVIYARKKSGCPACANRALFKGVNDLQTRFPNIAAEWHSTKNEGLTPSDIIAGSNNKYWWQCTICGHEWKATVYSRISGCGCPECGKIKRGKSKTATIVKTTGSLRETHPELIVEWNFERNKNISPDEVTYGSQEKVWWKCWRGHEWRASISSRTHGNGCQKCSDESHTSFPEQAICFYLAKYTEVRNREHIFGQEIDVYLPNMKIGIEYDGMYYHAHREEKDKSKVDYFAKHGIRIIRVIESDVTSVNGDEIRYIAKKDHRTLGETIQQLGLVIGIPLMGVDIKRDRNEIYSQFIYLEKENSLAKVCPKLAAEWDYEKNYPLTPEKVSYGSDKVVHWKCKNGHEWEATISSRNRKGVEFACGLCQGRHPLSPKKTEHMKIVLETLKKRPEITYSEIFEITGLSHGQIVKAIKSLKNDGVISRIGTKMRGYWKINEE